MLRVWSLVRKGRSPVRRKSNVKNQMKKRNLVKKNLLRKNQVRNTMRNLVKKIHQKDPRLSHLLTVTTMKNTSQTLLCRVQRRREDPRMHWKSMHRKKRQKQDQDFQPELYAGSSGIDLQDKPSNVD